jgi:hypothetical protein
MNEDLFSHPVDSQYVPPTYEGASNPVENPVFSDRDAEKTQRRN